MFDGYSDGHIFVGGIGKRQTVGEVFEVRFHFVSRPRRVGLEFAIIRVIAPVGPSHHVGKFCRFRIGLDGIKELAEKVDILVTAALNDAVVIQAKFSECGDFAMFGGQLVDHGQVVHSILHPFCIGLIVIALVGIVAHDVHIFVAGISGKVIFLAAVKRVVRRISKKQVIHAFGFGQIVVDVLPQRLEIICAHVTFAPPEPVAGVFMQRAEDDGDFAAVATYRVIGCRRNGIKPVSDFVVQVATRQQAINGNATINIKGFAIANRIVQMRGKGHNRAERIRFDKCFGKCLASRIRAAVGFYRRFVGIKTEYSRVFACHGVHIRSMPVAVCTADTLINGMLLAK